MKFKSRIKNGIFVVLKYGIFSKSSSSSLSFSKDDLSTNCGESSEMHCENDSFNCLNISIRLVKRRVSSADLSTEFCTSVAAIYVKNAHSNVGIIAIKEKQVTQSTGLFEMGQPICKNT